MNMPKSRDIQVKIPSPKEIFNGFCLVTVKVLNSYDIIIMGILRKEVQKDVFTEGKQKH